MQILLGDNNRIMGYATVGGFVGGIDVQFTPDDMPDFAAGKYILQNGVPVQNPDYVAPPEPEEETGRDPLAVLQETVDMLVITTLGGGSDV